MLSFESLTGDIVSRHGGRVVKAIGDEVAFVAPTATAACAIAREWVEAVNTHDVLAGLHAGLALGPVVVRDGDYFGATVHLACRLADLAARGTVLTSEGIARSVRPSEALVQGFPEPVPVFLLGDDKDRRSGE